MFTGYCVVRNGQYVKASEVPFLTIERLFFGTFTEESQRTGPSTSHVRTICLPIGKMTKIATEACVLREVAPSDYQYVPISEDQDLWPDEPVLVGVFTHQIENLGPHKSHRRTICLPTHIIHRTTGAAFS